MKNILIVFSVIVIAFTSNVFSQSGQPHCGSQLDFEEMQRTDSARYQLVPRAKRLAIAVALTLHHHTINHPAGY